MITADCNNENTLNETGRQMGVEKSSEASVIGDNAYVRGR